MHNAEKAILPAAAAWKSLAVAAGWVIDNGAKFTICFVFKYEKQTDPSRRRADISFTEPSRRFTRIIGRRGSKPIKTRDTKFDYDNRAALLIIIFRACAERCYVNKSEKYRERLLIIDNCIDVSVSWKCRVGSRQDHDMWMIPTWSHRL